MSDFGGPSISPKCKHGRQPRYCTRCTPEEVQRDVISSTIRGIEATPQIDPEQVPAVDTTTYPGRVQDVAHENFGPFPTQTDEEALTAIELGIFGLRRANQQLVADKDRATSDAATIARLEREVSDLKGSVEYQTSRAETHWSTFKSCEVDLGNANRRADKGRAGTGPHPQKSETMRNLSKTDQLLTHAGRALADPLPPLHATTDGIATGLSRALVALEQRMSMCTVAGSNCQACAETDSCIQVVRSLLEATVDHGF